MTQYRFPEFKRDKQGNPLCRGCGKIVKPPRRTWCSEACIEKYHPWNVKKNVWQRDKGTCQDCKTFLGVIGKTGKLLSHLAWFQPTKRFDFDHIIPYSEGGPTTADNMQVLCVKCHKKKTKAWYKEKRRLKKCNKSK